LLPVLKEEEEEEILVQGRKWLQGGITWRGGFAGGLDRK
jgi:hypothetical protein